MGERPTSIYILKLSKLSRRGQELGCKKQVGIVVTLVVVEEEWPEEVYK